MHCEEEKKAEAAEAKVDANANSSDLAEKKQEKRGLSDFGHGWEHDVKEEKTLTIVKKIPQPYPVYKHIPVEHVKHVPVPYKVGVPKPYPVVKTVHYPVKEVVKVPYNVPKPYPVVKESHYPVHVKVDRPVPVKVNVPQPYPVSLSSS